MKRREFLTLSKDFVGSVLLFKLIPGCNIFSPKMKQPPEFSSFDFKKFRNAYPKTQLEPILKKLISMGIIKDNKYSREKFIKNLQESPVVEFQGWLYPQIELQVYFTLSNIL